MFELYMKSVSQFREMRARYIEIMTKCDKTEEMIYNARLQRRNHSVRP